MLLGASSQYCGYNCLSKTSKIFISKDIIFHEHLFPFPTLFPSDSFISHPQASDPESLPFPHLQVSKGSSPLEINLVDNVPLPCQLVPTCPLVV